MPTENRIRRDERRNLRQTATTERRVDGSQAPPLLVGEPHAPAGQLCLQDAVLFAQVLDDPVLFALEPAEDKRDQQVQRNHASSLRHLQSVFSDTRGSQI